MKKQLPTQGITNELVGSSVFFAGSANQSSAIPVPSETKPVLENSSVTKHNDTEASTHHGAKQASKHDTMPPRLPDSVVSRNHEITQPAKHAPTVAGRPGPTLETDQETTYRKHVGNPAPGGQKVTVHPSFSLE